ncbi:MAG: RecX family transcriptional regulator [Clostridiales bacterium]|nr:RecX family transcriptional regulator [Clostridiales bacterium]
MIILRMENLKKHRIKVIFDEASYVLNDKLQIDLYLYVGKEMTEEEVAEMVHKGQYFNAFDLAVNYIAYQRRTCDETKKRLLKDEYDISVIEQVIDLLIKEKYLDDAEYANDYYESYRKKNGVFKIVANLKNKGIEENVLDQISMEDDSEVAFNFLIKKYGDDFNELSYEQKGKMSQYLSQRGFQFDTIKQVVNRYEQTISEKL